MSTKTIPVAYVTKWAASSGITVIRDAVTTESGALKKQRGLLYVLAKDWTTDKAEAEKRWRVAVTKAATLVRRKAERLESEAMGAPKYDPQER